MSLRRSCCLVLLCVIVAPAAGQTTFDPIALSGYVQSRYEYTVRAQHEDLSSFYLSRVRLQFAGTAAPRLTFLIMPEFARSASMRDAWVNYHVSPMLSVRAGQFAVPFQWHRYVSQRTHHFAERGLPSETFGMPDGRDLGVMFHGINAVRTLQYQVGIFDGSGRNTMRSNSAGHLFSGRLSIAAMGELPREESDYSRSPQPNVAVGMGVQGATLNELRQWDLGRSAHGNGRADWITATADLNVQYRGFSVTADGYLRRVAPDDPAVGAYEGGAFMISTGLFVHPRVELAARYADLRLDFDDSGTRQREVAVGPTIYLPAHGTKLRAQYFTTETAVHGFGRNAAFILELQVSF